MATYNNFSVSKKKAEFYLKANQPTDGYEEVKYGENKVTYHKYFKSVSGLPKSFNVKEVQYEGRTLRFLEITLLEGDDTYNKISLPLKNKGGYTDEVRKFVSALNGADVTQRVSFSMKKNTYTKKDGSSADDFTVFCNYLDLKNSEGKNLSTGYIKYEDIPKPEQKVVAGDTVWDFTPQTEFFYNKILEITKKFEEIEGSNHSEESTTDVLEDDLPF